jgi:hypothetical protein
MSEELDPRQMDFVRFYLDPKSETFSKAEESAKKAKYSDSYSNVISARIKNGDLSWMSAFVSKKEKLVNKAENNLEEILDLESAVIANRDGELIEASNLEILKLKNNTSQFIAKTLGKEKGDTERTEMTAKDGKDLIPDQASKAKSEEAIKEFINVKNTTNPE